MNTQATGQNSAAPGGGFMKAFLPGLVVGLVVGVFGGVFVSPYLSNGPALTPTKDSTPVAGRTPREASERRDERADVAPDSGAAPTDPANPDAKAPEAKPTDPKKPDATPAPVPTPAPK